MNIKNLLIGLLITSILITSYLIYRTETLENRFETLKEYQTKQLKKVKLNDNQLKFLQFKEDSYIRHQERDTTLILFVFATIVAGASFITFAGVKRELKSNVAMIEDKYNEQHTKWEKEHHKIIKLESDFYLQMGHSFINMGNDALRDKNIVYYVGYYVQACKYYCDYLTSNPSSKYMDKEIIQNIIIDLHSATMYEEELIINGISEEFMRENITSINSIVSPEYSLMLAGVINKLKLIKPENTSR